MTEGPLYPGTPRWVKIAGIIVVVLVLLVVAAVALGIGGEHGPGRHMGGASSATNHTVTQGTHDGSSPVADGALPINVTANDLAFDRATISVPVGTNVAIRLTATDTLHDFTIDELDAHVAADAGQTATGGFHAAPPGQYTYYCSVPGHREAGMEGTLIVEESAGHTRPAGH